MKMLFVLIKVLVTLTIFVIFENFYLLLNNNLKVIQYGINETARDLKVIVLWTNYSRAVNWHVPAVNGPEFFKSEGCIETRCKIVVTTERYNHPATDYDAFLFNAKEVSKKKQNSLPKIRLPHQIYVFVSKEAPQRFWRKIVNFNVQYNMTSKRGILKLIEFLI